MKIYRERTVVAPLASLTLFLAAGLLSPQVSAGAMISYTSSAAFLAALGGMGATPQVVDFESVAADTLIDDGDSIDGIQFLNFDLGDSPQLIVTDFNDAVSPTNYLGVDFEDNDYLIVGGDEFDLGFITTNGFGLFIITSEVPNTSIFSADIQLNIPGHGTASIDVGALEGTLGDGSRVYFIGAIDLVPFSFAELRYDIDAVGATTFNIDDIITSTIAVPEPATLALMLLAAIGGLRLRRRRH